MKNDTPWIPIEELLSNPAPPPPPRFKIGDVEFDPETLEIRISGRYTIDCVSAWCDGAGVLDSILQVAKKPWMTPENTAALLEIVNEIARAGFKDNAQGVFCPHGQNRRPDWAEAREQLASIAADLKDDPLVDKYFHSFDADGKINWQGRVLYRMPDGNYGVELGGWLSGRSERKTLDRAEMDGWAFYDTADEMNRAFEAEDAREPW